MTTREPLGPSPAFPPTRWSVVLAARGEAPVATDALEALCRAYWLAPARRAATAILIRNYLTWLLCLLTLFFVGLHGLTVKANQVNPPRLSMDALMALIIAFFLVLIVW